METLTWYDIEEYVLDGDECDAVQQKILHADMVSSLMAIWAKCNDDKFYETVVTTTIPTGTYEWPLQSVATDIDVITHMVTRTEDGVCTLLQTTGVTCLDATEEVPSHFEVKGYGANAKIFFNTVTDAEYDFTITYQRNPATSIFELDESFNPEYQVPDIPPQLYSVLRDSLKARRFVSIQDWSNASPQLQLANNSFDSIKPALDKGDSADGPSVFRLTKEGPTTSLTSVGTGGTASGISSFSGLLDTDLSGMSNGDLVEYNSTTGKWEAVAPSALTANAATTENSGLVELATTAEVDAGTDTERAVTPIALEQSARSVKLDAIEAGATADLTGAEIKTLYEARPDTNAFTDSYVSQVGVNSTKVSYTDAATVALNAANRWVKQPGEPNGFENREDCVLSWNDGSRTLTLTGTYAFWSDQTRFVKTNDSFTITDTEGLHFIYYNSSGDLAELLAFNISIIDTYAYVAVLYWDAVNNVVIPTVMNEQHGSSMSAVTHTYLHNSIGTVYNAGIGITATSVDGTGNDDDNARFASSAGSMWDEDILHAITARASTDAIPILWREGAAGLWRMDNTAEFLTLKGSVRAYWNEWTGATWQLTEVTNNDYVLAHVISIPGVNEDVGSLAILMGQNEYNLLADAQDGALVEMNQLNLDGIPAQEFLPCATFILQTSTGFSNAVASKVVSTDTGDDFIDWRQVLASGLGSSSAAVAWGGITGGDPTVQSDLNALLTATDANVTANAGNISTNTGNISTNTADITTLEGEQIVQDAAIALNTAKLTANTANVTSAGALMDSEVDASIKSLALPDNTTISAAGAGLIDDASVSAMRTTLDISAANTPVTDTDDLFETSNVEAILEEIGRGGGERRSTNCTGSVTIPLYPYQRLTLTGNATLNMPTPTTQGHTLVLRISGAFTLAWGTGVEWADGSPPTYTSVALYVVSTTNGGTEWLATQVGASYS